MDKNKNADITYIDEVIFCYHENKYDEMTALIIDYPAPLFFVHLYEYSTGVKWRSDASKYLLFVAITIEFIKETNRIKS
jgi:hypothetical protein